MNEKRGWRGHGVMFLCLVVSLSCRLSGVVYRLRPLTTPRVPHFFGWGFFGLQVEMMLAGKIAPSGVIRPVCVLCPCCARAVPVLCPCCGSVRVLTPMMTSCLFLRHRAPWPRCIVGARRGSPSLPLTPGAFYLGRFRANDSSNGAFRTKEIYEPLLAALAEQGIEMVETETRL